MIKNDTSRTGFEIRIPASSEQHVDPVSCLKCYIDRTQHLRVLITDQPIFLSLKAPYHGISGQTIGSILSSAINLAGLGGKGYSPRCFRPTGATAAIQCNSKPETVMQIGRWKLKKFSETDMFTRLHTMNIPLTCLILQEFDC